MMVEQLTTCQPSDTVGRERTRFFPGFLLGSDDLTQDQTYFREKLRRHNRMLHGWGVVCGARVRAGQGACQIVIEPGYILGPFGDEIMIEQETTVDLCREGLDGNAVSPCGDGLDPWCSDVAVDRRAGQTLYIAIRYDECQTRPVRSAVGGCGCDTAECEHSRIRDSFTIKILTRLPSTYDPMPPTDLLATTTCRRTDLERGRSCTSCPTEPWVILADVTMAPNRQINGIDCFTHRRYVVSFADYYFLCNQQDFREIPEIIRAREIAQRLGRPELVDLQADPNTQPSGTVAVRTMGNEWLSLPIHFNINPGETWAALLERERDREFYNPIDDERYTLSELIALTGVDPNETIDSISEVLLPLEGLQLNVRDLRVVKGELENLLSDRAIQRWEREHAGSIASLTTLRAVDIEGVNARSTLGRRLEGLSIGDIATTDRETFVTQVLEDVAAGQRAAVERQARGIWATASRLARRQEAWLNR